MTNVLESVRLNALLDKVIKWHYDDDFIDRINHSFIAIVLNSFSIFLIARHSIGHAIQCYIPKEYPFTWEGFIRTYCFIENTYYVNDTLTSYPRRDERHATELYYYQWQPLIFIGMAVIAFAPKLLYRAVMHLFSSHNYPTVIDALSLALEKNKKEKVENWKKAKTDRTAGHQVAQRLIAIHKERHPNWKSPPQSPVGQNELQSITKSPPQSPDGQNELEPLKNSFLQSPFNQYWRKPVISDNIPHSVFGWSVSANYVLMKIGILVSIIVNLYVMKSALGASSIFWAGDLIDKLAAGDTWKTNGYFPRVTFCDVDTRDIGQARSHTVQCLIMLNMFIEKMYLILWVYFLIMIVVTFFNLAYWIVRLLNGNAYVRDVLTKNGYSDATGNIEVFTRDYLNTDGISVLYLIESNNGYLVMADVCTTLYKHYYDI